MSWCLDCHRAPEKHLRPPELVTAMDWVPAEDRWSSARSFAPRTTSTLRRTARRVIDRPSHERRTHYERIHGRQGVLAQPRRARRHSGVPGAPREGVRARSSGRRRSFGSGDAPSLLAIDGGVGRARWNGRAARDLRSGPSARSSRTRTVPKIASRADRCITPPCSRSAAWRARFSRRASTAGRSRSKEIPIIRESRARRTLGRRLRALALRPGPQPRARPAQRQRDARAHLGCVLRGNDERCSMRTRLPAERGSRCSPKPAPPPRCPRRAQLLAARFPQMQWVEWESVSRDAAREATKALFGEAMRPQLHLDRADVVVSLRRRLPGRAPGAASRTRARSPAAGARKTARWRVCTSSKRPGH